MTIILSILVILGNNVVPNNKDLTPSEKGVEWLIREQADSGTDSSGTGLRLIYKVTTDPNLAARLFDLVRKNDKLETLNPTIISETDDIYRNWWEIEGVAIKLFKEQCGGKDVSLEVAKLKKIFYGSKNQIKNAIKQKPTLVITTLYFLGKLGISDEILLNHTIQTLRSGNGDSSQELYGLTHIIFVKSDFMESYLNPVDFPKEVELFERLLSTYAKSDEIDLEKADVLSEMIISLKLLGRGESNEINTVRQRLIKMQDDDGSWGGDRHTTVVATLALMDFTDTLRKTNGYCSPGF